MKNLKSVPPKNKGLKKLPTEVRNKMGYKAKGGMAAKKKMAAGGRTVSRTDASTAKSTPPKTGKDASFQRIVNSMTSFIKNNDLTTLTGAIKEAKEKAKGLKGPKISEGAMKALKKKGEKVMQAPKEYKRPSSGKAYGGKTKK